MSATKSNRALMKVWAALLLAAMLFAANIASSYANSKPAKGKGKKGAVVELTPEERAQQEREAFEALVNRESELQKQIASLKEEIAGQRSILSSKLENREEEISEDEQNDLMEKIRSMEDRLFDKASELSTTSNKIAQSREQEEIESIEILDEGEHVESGIFKADSATRLTMSRAVRENLSLQDFNTLHEADLAESHVFLLHAEYLIRHERLRDCA